ncbi:MAG: hypothetical protein ACTHM9_12300 [Gemmatimonadales bacterium]
MTFLDRCMAPLAAALLLAACGSGGPEQTSVDCSTASPTVLTPGQGTIIDAGKQGCLSLPGAGANGAEYLYFAGITDGTVSRGGTAIPYQLYGAPGGVAVRAAHVARPLASLRQGAPAREFHGRLRQMERDVAQGLSRAPHPTAAARATAAPPAMGDQRTFNVLANGTASGTKASDYLQVTGTVQYVGSHAAVYLDNNAPTPTYSPDDITAIGTMFDSYLYPIDTTAFGRESDIDQNGLVLILLTDRVTKIVPCNGTSQVIGFFLPFDLQPSHVGSNAGEIFYGLVPDASCNVSVDDARFSLPPVMIHEFQHMISFNQHVLSRGGGVEQTWLNEGLSSFAEELGGRLVPDASCQNNDCLTQFTLIDLDNANSYLTDPVSNYLIGPDRVPIPLEEYGAGWLFVRWLLDHYATTATLGTDLTRRLDATTRTGADNVVDATGPDFASLVMHWQFANYLDDLPGFTPGDPLDQYVSWNFRDAFASLHASFPGMFGSAYPLAPPTAVDGRFEESGTLPAGSGRHVLVNLSPNAAAPNLALTDTDGLTALPASAGPRIGIVRIR